MVYVAPFAVDAFASVARVLFAYTYNKDIYSIFQIERIIEIMSREICVNYDESDVTCESCILNKVQNHNSCYKPVKKEQNTTMQNNVNTGKINPSHYKSENGRECIDELRLMFGDEQVKAFCRCNAYKYRFRAGRKQNESAETDLAKAEWYLNYLEKLEKGEV